MLCDTQEFDAQQITSKEERGKALYTRPFQKWACTSLLVSVSPTTCYECKAIAALSVGDPKGIARFIQSGHVPGWRNNGDSVYVLEKLGDIASVQHGQLMQTKRTAQRYNKNSLSVCEWRRTFD